MIHKPTIVPHLSYPDGHEAVDFLQDAHGFEPVQSFDAADGTLMHCELAFGNCVIMLGTAEAAKGSPGLYLVVADVDAAFQRAQNAGAEIFYSLEDTEFGSRRCHLRDPEGHEWSLGSYAPQTTAPDWG